MPEWQLEEPRGEEGEEKEWDKRRDKAGEWTFSKKEIDGKELSWGTDKDLASEQEVGEDVGGGREKKAANQANILNILSQLIIEANEDKEDEEREERQSRYLQSPKSFFSQSIARQSFISCLEGAGRVEPVVMEDVGVRVGVVRG